MLESIGMFLALLIIYLVLKKVTAALDKKSTEIEARVDATNARVRAWSHRVQDKYRPPGTPARAELNRQIHGLLRARIDQLTAREPASPRRLAPPSPTPQPTLQPPPRAASTRAEQQTRWAGARAKFRAAQVQMAAYETDPALAIDFPAFNDVTVPEVKAMVGALRRATHVEDSTQKDAPVGGSPGLLDEYESAVLDFALGVDVAERTARRLRWSYLPMADRDDLEQIQHLLNHARNPGNTDEARATYYGKLQRVIRKLNDRHGADVVPTQALAAIEGTARLGRGT